MRSYYSHLKTFGSTSRKPVFRTSAIFPVWNEKEMTTRILFMGYWLLKRGIKELGWVTTLRSQDGNLLARHIQSITTPQAQRVELQELLEQAGISLESSFQGSLELEFFSSQPLVFPFPATVINLYGPGYSTMVHTAQRIYNDLEDKEINSVQHVPEAGFNLHCNGHSEPFVAIINGFESIDQPLLEMEIINCKAESLTIPFAYPELKPYELVILSPTEKCDLAEFLYGEPGTAKVKYHFPWIFPRVIAGNRLKHPKGAVITHTYYDCTESNTSEDYWNVTDKDHEPASLMVPADFRNDRFTHIYFYPIYSPGSFSISLEFYDMQGELVKKFDNILIIESPFTGYKVLKLKEILDSNHSFQGDVLGARIIAKSNGDKIPARIKIGLDVGISSKGLPCNICTNLQPYVAAWETKPQTFKWGPFIDRVWLMNSSPHINRKQEATLTLQLHRESDSESVKRDYTLPQHGFLILERSEFIDFFKDEIGWYTITSTNPYCVTYYFHEGTTGIMGGDHGF
ncbi:MAG: hypothetical protein Tsb0021_15030 [Chlamydiales bacterium]